MRIKNQTRARIGLACALVSYACVLAIVLAVTLAGMRLDGNGIAAIVAGSLSMVFGLRTWRIFRGRS